MNSPRPAPKSPNRHSPHPPHQPWVRAARPQAGSEPVVTHDSAVGVGRLGMKDCRLR